jgi:hypothetical protein
VHAFSTKTAYRISGMSPQVAWCNLRGGGRLHRATWEAYGHFYVKTICEDKSHRKYTVKNTSKIDANNTASKDRLDLYFGTHFDESWLNTYVWSVERLPFTHLHGIVTRYIWAKRGGELIIHTIFIYRLLIQDASQPLKLKFRRKDTTQWGNMLSWST